VVICFSLQRGILPIVFSEHLEQFMFETHTHRERERESERERASELVLKYLVVCFKSLWLDLSTSVEFLCESVLFKPCVLVTLSRYVSFYNTRADWRQRRCSVHSKSSRFKCKHLSLNSPRHVSKFDLLPHTLLSTHPPACLPRNLNDCVT